MGKENKDNKKAFLTPSIQKNCEPMDIIEEQQLVAQAQKGHEQAVVQLYEKYLPIIYRFLYSQIGNREEAEDITQDTLTEAFRGLSKFKAKASFKNWLYQIAKYKLADWWRQKYKKPTVPLEDFCPVHIDPDIFFDEDNMIETREKEAKLNEILKDLPENYRRVLEYRFLKNYTLKETALEMNKTEGNIKVLQFRALKKASILADKIYE